MEIGLSSVNCPEQVNYPAMAIRNVESREFPWFTQTTKTECRSLSHLYPQDFNLWRWLNDNMERSIPLKEELWLTFPESGGTPHHTEPRGSTRFWSTGRSRSLGQNVYGSLCRKCKTEQGNILGLVSLNHSGRLWAVGVLSNCLVPGPGTT